MSTCLQEEIASINLAKYRKVQCELEEAEERADSAENTLAKLRAKIAALCRHNERHAAGACRYVEHWSHVLLFHVAIAAIQALLLLSNCILCDMILFYLGSSSLFHKIAAF